MTAHGSLEAVSTHARTALIVSPYFPPHLGGVEQYVKNVGRLLQSRHGWRIVVATSSPSRIPSRFVDKDTGLRVYEMPTQLHVSNTPIGFSWRGDLKSIIEREEVDLINAHAPVPYMAEVAMLAGRGIPFVLTYHAGRARMLGGPRAAILRLHQTSVLPRTARYADEIVCSSDAVAGEFASAFAGRRVTTVSPGVDPDRFPSTPVPTTSRILFVGSLMKATSYKGLSTLLDVCARIRRLVPDTQLEIVGDGDDRSGYERRCHELGIGHMVTFSGTLSGTELTDAYRRSTVVALPSRYDSFPTVLIEAMSSGRPVVSTQVGGIASLVDEGETGFLVDPSDRAALTGRLVDVLSDHHLATCMGRAGATKARAAMTWGSRAERTHEVFSRVLAAPASSRRTVAIVTPYFTPKVGGVENYASRVSRAVAAQADLRPLVITTGTTGIWRIVDEGGELTTIRLPAVTRLSNTPVNPLWLMQLRRIFRQHNVDVVTTHAPVPLFADAAVAAAGGRPVIETYHAGSMVKGVWWMDPFLRFYERRVLPRTFARAGTLVAVSPASLAFPLPGSVMVPPGVDVATFVPRAPGSHERDDHPSPSALYVGRMDRASRWKGVDVLIRAFRLVHDSRPSAMLRLVGAGDDVTRLKALVDELGLGEAVEFTGVLLGPELVAAYQDAAVLVLPSLTESESFGMTLIEAMACGTPVIGSKVGGIPFVVTHEHDGLLVDPGDVAGLATAVDRVFDDPGLRARLGEAGRRSAEERFSWDAQLQKHLDLIRGVLTEERNPCRDRQPCAERQRRERIPVPRSGS